MSLSLFLAPVTFGAFASWAVALVSALRMVRKRAPGVSIADLALNGFAFFDERNFLPEAAADARRMRNAFASFFGFVLLGLLLGLLLADSPARAQPASPEPPRAAAVEARGAEADAAPPDPQSPQASMADFFALARRGRFEQAARYLELPASADAATQARRLSLVLDRTVWVDLERLSPAASGDTRDGLPAGVDQIAEIPAATRGGEPEPVRIARRPTPEGHRWRFTRATTDRIDGWYRNLDGRYLLDRVPTRLLAEGPFHIAHWQWIGLVVLTALALLAGVLLAGLLRLVGLALARRTAVTWDDELVDRLVPPVRLGLALVAFDAALVELGLARPVAEAMHHAIKLLLVLVALSATMRAVRVTATQLAASEWGRSNPSSRSLVTLFARTLQVAAVVVAVLAVLSTLGYDVTGLIAGLGVGGVVLALAAQKTVENLIGAFAIGLDQPLREGDQVKIDGVAGTVERVGLRSTRLRTQDRHVVAYPNGKLADTPIESVTARDRMRIHTTLMLEYGTSSEKLRSLRDELERVARAHPKIYPDELHIRFAGFGASSLDIEVMLWMMVRDYASFVQAREELLLAFMQAVEAEGIGFAFPTRTVHLVDERTPRV